MKIPSFPSKVKRRENSSDPFLTWRSHEESPECFALAFSSQMTVETQLSYWTREGTTKTFSHPVNLGWLREHFNPDARILDYGCGYGRVAALLYEEGYREVVGVDAAGGMVEKARRLHPHLSFQRTTPPNVPFPDGFFDAVMLFAVLTCIPADDDQRAVIDELQRVTRPGGLLYISDLWLQTDERNCQRYAQFEKTLPYGVFEVSEGVAVRHHSRQWIASLLCQWETIASCDIQVTTMNGHEAAGFQWLGRNKKRGRNNCSLLATQEEKR
jgi:SAM-dependent methyltransferase